jgi:hypothetical protein
MVIILKTALGLLTSLFGFTTELEVDGMGVELPGDRC